MSIAFLLLWSASLICMAVAGNESHCFPGLHHFECPSNKCCCKHDSFNGLLKCHPGGSLGFQVFNSKCVTYYDSSDIIVAGSCPYMKFNSGLVLPPDLPSHSELNKVMCQNISRNGTMCGKCVNNYVPAVNSYDFKCMPKDSCTSVNWLLYFLTKYGPLTVFYLIIFLFRINAAAPYISLLILLAQVITSRNILLVIFAGTSNRVDSDWTRFLVSLYTVWNLDVLQIYMPPLCLSKYNHNLDALALDYLVALYPLLLVLVTYCLAELHARRWWCVFWFFWPLVKLFKLLRINIDPMRSIMNTFATFILLSITKFTIVSFNLLASTKLFDANGTLVRHVPFFDGDTDYFSGRHLPHAILAIIVLLIFNLLPLLLLLLSPLKYFQQCLRWCCCSFRGVHLVNTFLEVFQGHFKDGVSHRRDYRFVAGLQFLLRFIMLAVFNSTLSFEHVYTCTLVVLILWTVGGLMVRPYKRELYNILEAVLGTYITFLLILPMYYYVRELKGYPRQLALLYIVVFTPGILHILYMFVGVLQMCGCHVKLKQFAYKSLSTGRQHFPFIRANREGQGYMSIGDLPPPLQRNEDTAS